MRSLNNRKCGALEAADTLRNLLYDTNSDTIVKWIDINEMRNKEVKTFIEIKALDENSANIHCPSLINNYYPRPKDLESLNCMTLSDFGKLQDRCQKMKSNIINLYWVYF